MSDDSVKVTFNRLSAPVEIARDDRLLACLERILPGWHFLENENAGPASTKLHGRKYGYHLTSPRLEKSKRYQHEVDAVCALIVELVWGYLEEHPELLCLHGAAAEFSGRLVVFPSRYRAGKSLLSAALAARGVRLFADDVLPVLRPAPGQAVNGIAPGIQPRLRLPLPDNLDRLTRDFVTRRPGPESKRYRYLALTAEELAAAGESAPIGAFVLLERDDDASLDLSPLAADEVLRHVIWQNFARDRGAARILDELHGAVVAGQHYRLRYSSTDAAAALLLQRFMAWEISGITEEAPRASPPASDPSPGADPLPPSSYLRRPEVVEKTVGDEQFLAELDGTRIYHLNPTAAAVWRLLAEPRTEAEIVEIVQAAFPEVDRRRIQAEIGALIESLRAKGLLVGARAVE